jgi:hypothetical protein
VSVLGQVRVLNEFTNAADKLRDAINMLVQRPGAQDGSRVLDGVLEAGKALEKRRAARPAILVLTVSAGDKSGSGPGEVLRILKQTMASFHVVAISNALVSSGSQGGRVGDLIEQNVNINQLLDDGPKQSGGRRANVSSLPDANAAVGKIADQLLHQYAVSYKLPDGVKLNERLQVTVKRPGATVMAPTKIADR